jgi:hypothetical protein
VAFERSGADSPAEVVAPALREHVELGRASHTLNVVAIAGVEPRDLVDAEAMGSWLFQRAAEGKRGHEALDAIGEAYADRLWSNPIRLQVQMQAYAACGDPDIRAVVRNGVGDLFAYVERVGGLADEQTAHFFAVGMLMNLIASMHLVQGVEPWADRLVAGCDSHMPATDGPPSV